MKLEAKLKNNKKFILLKEKIEVKINTTIETKENDVDEIKQEIIHAAAHEMLNEVIRNQDHYGRTFKDDLREEIRSILSETFDLAEKNEIKELVAKDIKSKYIKTKQYKELKDEFDIMSDKDIKSGLREIITDIVKEEIKKYFARL